MNVDRSGRAEIIVAPDLIEEHFSRQDPPGMTQQMFKKSEFLSRKGDILSLYRDLVAVKVHGQLAVLIGGLAFLTAAIRAAKQRFDAGHECFRTERLGD